MIDGMEDVNTGFYPATATDKLLNYTLGINGIWLVNTGSNNFFKSFENESFQGIEASNCCRHFVIAIKKQ